MLDIDIVMTRDARLHVIDVKAAIRGAGGVESLDVIAGGTDADALVRHAAALQLIDVKAHVLGGLA